MEQKTKALKNASKVISIIMKIGYIAMIVAICACIASLIFLAATDGKTSIDLGDTTVGVTDAPISTEEVIVMCVEYLVMSGFLFAIFLIAQLMFGKISVTGDPFDVKYVKSVRTLGILIAVMTVATGVINSVISSLASVKGLEAYTEAPGIVFGAVVFCLSYIIDYGCGLKENK